MTEKRPIMLAQDNLLTQSRYDFSVVEKRCLYQVIRQVRSDYIEPATKSQMPDLFQNMRVTITKEQLADCRDNTKLKDVYKSLENLRLRNIEIDNDDEWMTTGFITMAKHNKRSGDFTVEVSSAIMPYLVELAGNFTSYDLTVAISLKSSYSQRFYELCCQYRNRPNKTFFLSVDDIRHMMMLEEKYQNGSDFKRFVLDVAQRELKELYDKGQCDLWFDYSIKDTLKRKILSYYFFIHTKEEEKLKTNYKTVQTSLERINSILSTFFPRDKKYIKRVIQEIQLRPDIAMELAEKINKKVLDYEKKEIPPIIRFVLNEDYGIK